MAKENKKRVFRLFDKESKKVSGGDDKNGIVYYKCFGCFAEFRSDELTFFKEGSGCHKKKCWICPKCGHKMG